MQAIKTSESLFGATREIWRVLDTTQWFQSGDQITFAVNAYLTEADAASQTKDNRVLQLDTTVTLTSSESVSNDDYIVAARTALDGIGTIVEI